MLRLLSLLLIIPFVKVNAADSTSTWNDVIKTFKKKELSAKQLTVATAKTLKNIEVFDMRSDTNRVGMFADFKFKPTEVVFENSESLKDIFNLKLVNAENNGHSILMVVEDFWLNEIHAQKVLDKENQAKPVVHTSKIVCKIDVFVKQGNEYYPLTRIDTVLWNKKSVVFSSSSLVSDALTIINNKITASIADNTFAKRKKALKEEIFAAYQQRFSYPAFMDKCPKKGLYTSLEEFKNNTPYAEHFMIETHRKEPPSLFIIDDKGNETITHNVWGVCDGKNMYIMQKGMLFKLYKNDKAFYWMGVKYFDQRMYETPPVAALGVGAEVGMAEPVASSVKIRLTPYLLHPETGEGY